MRKKFSADARGYTLINQKKLSKINRKKYLCLSGLVCGLVILTFSFFNQNLQKVSAENQNEIEQAIYTRTEFFGAEAIVTLPTNEARENLLRLSEKFPENREVLEKLAEFDEKLLKFDEAEKNLLHLAEIDFSANERLAEFYGRRSNFEKQAAIYQKILFSSDTEKRSAAFEKLLSLAQKHELKQYLQTNFYNRVASENLNVFPVFKQLIDRFAEEKNYADALKFLRQAKAQFPEYKNFLLKQEIKILLESKQIAEAVKVYSDAFDPFWSEAEADAFYSFLSEQDILRIYGASVRNRFRENPADFDAAIRLLHYQNHDYEYGNDNFAPIILRLEQAKKSWTADELVKITRILLRENEGETASRFLYTLWLREDFQKNTTLRAKVLYQLFEMFSDAETERLPLTKGDLRFYEDIARADTRPGISTGILSLIFSDTNLPAKFAEQEEKAAQLFNRAAAYRIFLAYKEEFSTAPELAQMYLDVVRFYSAVGKIEIAEKTLDEFAGRFENSTDFPAAALKLADAYIALKQTEKSREVYQKILDYIGKQGKPLQTKQAEDFTNLFEKPDIAERENSFDEIVARNDGINIPKPEKTPENNYYEDEKTSKYRDYLGRKTSAVTYEEVLDKLVASLSAEKQTAEILAVYSREISKYPNEEFLYERRLSWLEQANLTNEQLQVYITALARFQTNDWRDKLARFFIRQNRKTEYAEFSEELIGKLNDEETEKFLADFVEVNITSKEFEKQLFLKLYEKARKRFPGNVSFTKGLLHFYKSEKRFTDWRKLCAENYFISQEIREEFLADLSEKDELRNFLQIAKLRESPIYAIFRADAAVYLSDYENAVDAYRILNEIYPNMPEFQTRLINFTRSFGQTNRAVLTETAKLAENAADFDSNRADLRTQSGEIRAELGDYVTARREWEKLIPTARGEKEIYLETATIYWDYFQYDDALRTIKNLREKYGDDLLYAFEAAAIFEGQKKMPQAFGEYVKSLAERNETRRVRAVKRLAELSLQLSSDSNGLQDENLKKKRQRINQEEFWNRLEAVYRKELSKQKKGSILPIGYAEFLLRVNRDEKAENVLNQSVKQSFDAEFVKSAMGFFQVEEIKTGEQNALQRLGEIAENPREKIRYRLQLAEIFEENFRRGEAENVLANLVRDFPTNYGVLTETAEIYDRLGADEKAITVLQNALAKSSKKYKFALAEKLAKRLVRLSKLDAAEKVLLEMHNENKADIAVFEELAKVFVRQKKSAKMREMFTETLTAIKQSSKNDRRESDSQIARLREMMIDAFTMLKDYKSAVEQHIEIINREPEDEELTEAAIRYVKRYGGAETLLNYYLKLSAESFKNYRWNVVLARIYEADSDFENAVKNYQTAIINQPEMPELYEAIAEIETQRGNFDAALENFDKILELTNNAPEYVKKKVEILKKAGRKTEAETMQTQLPVEEKQVVNEFNEARNLLFNDREKARELYKTAWQNLSENPLQNEFKSADIAGYVEIVRDEEPLDAVNQKLWNLREKLLVSAGKTDVNEATEARKRLGILEGAIIESVGKIAKDFATDDELKNLHEQLNSALEKAENNESGNRIISIVQDISSRAGFGDLQEKILIGKVENVNLLTVKDYDLMNLVNFYNSRGAFQKTFDALEKYTDDYTELKAETAKLLGNKEKELRFLRKVYWETGDTATGDNVFVERYLQILHTENHGELKSLTEKTSRFQLQLINFLLGAGERELAHAAIENSDFSNAWKLGRNAEISLALREFDDTSECYFCDALQIDSIGNLIAQTPDKRNFLVNDDWFLLSRKYGEWLLEKAKSKGETSDESNKFLSAMTENLPDDEQEQFELGEFYLRQSNFAKAVEHLQISIKQENLVVADKEKAATLGAAFHKLGQKDSAEQLWVQVVEDKEITSGKILLDTLQKYALAAEARKNLPKIIVKFLSTANVEDSEDFQKLIRVVAASFNNEDEKNAWFLQVLQKRPTDKSLAKMLLDERLIDEKKRAEFYELLLRRTENKDEYNYDYAEIFQRVWNNTQDAESVFDAENDYKSEKSENARLNLQKEFLDYLLRERENAKAENLTTQIEAEIKGQSPRPDWLHLAKIRLQIRRGNLNLEESERFVGIKTSEAVTEIKTPSPERFNEVLRVFREEKNESGEVVLSESFFARMFALGRFDSANFSGLTRTFFRQNKTDKALRLLQLAIDASIAEKYEKALAEISDLTEIKAQAADETKTEKNEIVPLNQSEILDQSAEVAGEFNQTEKALELRRMLFETAPNDLANRLKLAEILFSESKKTEAAKILNELIADKNSLREIRWKAQMILLRNGEILELPNNNFDAFSQIHNGIFAEESARKQDAEEFLIKGLLCDSEEKSGVMQRLMKIYAENGKPFAALRLAESDKTPKSDALLDLLSNAGEKTNEFAKAIEFEKSKADGGNLERIKFLQNLQTEKLRRVTDFRVDKNNLRKL